MVAAMVCICYQSQFGQTGNTQRFETKDNSLTIVLCFNFIYSLKKKQGQVRPGESGACLHWEKESTVQGAEQVPLW